MLFLLAQTDTTSATITLLNWAGIVSFVLMGIFTVLGVFDKVTKSKKKDADELDNKLINLLKDEVASMQRTQADVLTQLTSAQGQLTNLTQQLSLVTHENAVLHDLIRGTLLEKKLNTLVPKEPKT